MKQLLVRRQSNNNQQLEWVMIDEGHMIDGPSQGTLEALTPIAQQYPIHIIISCQDISFFSVTLPPLLNAKKRAKAIPFTLEDKLLSPIETQHFALGKTQEQTIVAVINKVKLETLLTPWENFNVQSIIPDCLLIAEDKHWHILLEDHNAIIQFAKQQGFFWEEENISLELNQLLKQTPNKLLPEKIIITHLLTKKNIQLNLDENIEIEERWITQVPIEYFAQHFHSSDPINLLQGDFKPKKNKKTQHKLISYSAIIILATLSLMYVVSSWFSYHHQLNLLDKKITEVYQSIFPQATHVVAPQARIQQKLDNINNTNQKDTFFSTLNHINDSLKHIAGTVLNHLNYQGNIFILDISTDNFSNLEKFITDLNSKGLLVKQRQAGSQDGKITATLQVTS